MNPIATYLGTSVPEEEIAFLDRKARRVLLEKGEFFARPASICRSIGFVEAGLLRSYVTVYHKEYNIEG